jgi:hypothetical protein
MNSTAGTWGDMAQAGGNDYVRIDLDVCARAGVTGFCVRKLPCAPSISPVCCCVFPRRVAFHRDVLILLGPTPTKRAT